MGQLNIYLGPDDNLKGRLEASAATLGVKPNTLARFVVDEFLESYVGVAVEAEKMKRQSFRDLRQRLQHRSTTLGNDRFEAGSEASEFRVDEESRRKPRKRLRRKPVKQTLVATR